MIKSSYNPIFKRQFWHLAFLLGLLMVLSLLFSNLPKLSEGQLWGISTKTWSLLAIAVPIVHQVYVLLCWRFELYFQSLSKWFGSKGFQLYKIGFAVLILLRPISLVLLAISNAHTLHLPRWLSLLGSLVLFIPAAYLFYSVKTYFGMDRAFGIDHFYPELYKNTPIVSQGIFKYTSNGMYVFGFFLLWIPGLLWESKTALWLALFNHLYIWVHYYTTEKPDMVKIYG
ncbi:methyltransferase [Mangrovimonas xylaniphaga]|uniref:methyltransferase n=1 Tax=Mangrovimonas xylaniphaga TaxID=1645915 RepID=UPI0009E87373|nr:methyltransferase [Mangrovimonas xylaniphaga]